MRHWLQFIPQPIEFTKKVWKVLYDNTQDEYGKVKYKSNWESYCFIPNKDIVLDIEVLIELWNFIDDINRALKEERKSILY